MAQLALHFHGVERHPIYVDDDVPPKGTIYQIHGLEKDGVVQMEHWVVTMVRRELWPKKKYAQGADEHEYLAGGEWSILLVPAQASTGVRVRS